MIKAGWGTCTCSTSWCGHIQFPFEIAYQDHTDTHVSPWDATGKKNLWQTPEILKVWLIYDCQNKILEGSYFYYYANHFKSIAILNGDLKSGVRCFTTTFLWMVEPYSHWKWCLSTKQQNSKTAGTDVMHQTIMCIKFWFYKKQNLWCQRKTGLPGAKPCDEKQPTTWFVCISSFCLVLHGWVRVRKRVRLATEKGDLQLQEKIWSCNQSTSLRWQSTDVVVRELDLSCRQCYFSTMDSEWISGL